LSLISLTANFAAAICIVPSDDPLPDRAYMSPIFMISSAAVAGMLVEKQNANPKTTLNKAKFLINRFIFALLLKGPNHTRFTIETSPVTILLSAPFTPRKFINGRSARLNFGLE
jgi:hypothetical protein